jgi:hypothetical protein
LVHFVIRLPFRQCSHKSNQSDPSKARIIAIGGLKKTLKVPDNPELVPVKYLPKDEEIPPETLKVMF